MGTKPKNIKVCLTNQGEDSETPWAHDLGPAPGPPGSRKVRLVNVPFMHAKPTWGDVIVVSPVEDGFPTWDRGGVPWKQIDRRIFEDGGRWAMILDYVPHPDDKTGNKAYGALAHACAEHDIVCEGAWGPRNGDPGRAYLAVLSKLSDVAVMSHLREAELPCDLIQIHPEPVKPAVRKMPSKPVKKTPARPAAKPVKKSPAKKPMKKPPTKKRKR